MSTKALAALVKALGIGRFTALLKARYKRKIPTGRFRTKKDGSTGGQIFRYVYTDEAAAQRAQQGEHVNLQRQGGGVHEVAHSDDEGVTLRHTKTGAEKRMTHDEFHAAMASAYRKSFDKGAEALVRRYVAAASKIKADPGDAKAMHAELSGRFKSAGVDPEHAKRLVAFLATREGWHTDAKKALLAIASDPKAGKTIAPRGRQIARAAENLARADKSSEVKTGHVGQAVALRAPDGGFDSHLADLRQRVAVELAHTEALLGAVEAAGNNAAMKRAMVDHATQAMRGQSAQELEHLVNAYPGLRDVPEVERLRAARARFHALKAEREEERKPEKGGFVGAATSVYVADADGNPTPQKARYRLVDASKVIASHDPVAGFQQRKDYPEGVQERSYHRDKAEQEKVRRNAQGLKPAYVVNTNPDAVNGPPVMTADGVVLGGNSRTMSMQLAYEQHPEAAEALKDHLRENAHAFGFAKGDVDALERPILVREVEVEDQGKGNLGVLVRRYNESFTQGMDPRVDQVARGRMVTQGMMDSIAAGMGRTNDSGEPMHATLNSFLSSAEGARFVSELSSSREGKAIIDRRNRSQYVGKDGKLNEDGKTFVERVLVGHVLPDPDLLGDMLPKHVSAIAAVVPHVVGAASKGHDIKGQLKTALDAYAYMRRKGLADVDEYDRDSGGFASLGIEGFEQKPKLDEISKPLLSAIATRIDKPTQLAAFFREFASQARRNPAGQSNLLGESVGTADLLRGAEGRSAVGQRDMFKGSHMLEAYLSQLIAARDLAQSFHWNVTGPTFTSLHGLFGDEYEALGDMVDEVAERLRQTGVRVVLGMAARLEAPPLPDDSQGMLSMLSTLRTKLEATCAEAALAHESDLATLDLFTRQAVDHAKAAWMLRSHLEDGMPGGVPVSFVETGDALLTDGVARQLDPDPPGAVWVPLAEAFGAALWDASMVKGGRCRHGVMALPLDLHRLFRPDALMKHKGAVGGTYVKKVPTGKFRTKKDGSAGAPIYRYFYRVDQGGGVTNKDDFKVGAKFAHERGEYTIHSVKGGKLKVTHSGRPGVTEHLTHDELAAKLRAHHGAKIDTRKAEVAARLHAELRDAKKYGTQKHVDRILAEMKARGVPTSTEPPPLPGEAKAESAKPKAPKEAPPKPPEPPKPPSGGGGSSGGGEGGKRAWEEWGPRPKDVPVDFTGYPLGHWVKDQPPERFMAVTVKKVGEERGRGADKKVYGDAKVQDQVVFGFDYGQMLQDSYKALDTMPKILIDKALKSAGWEKDGTPIPITQEHVDTALREMRESLERSLAREHDRETGLRPLEIDGRKVRGAYVYRGDETNYTGPKENPPEPGTIYVHAVRVHSVELEPAENGEHRPATKAPITLAKEILGRHLPTSSYVSYRLNPKQDWKIRVSGQEITADDVRALLAKDGIEMRKALTGSDGTAHDSLLYADGELVPDENGVIDLGDILEGKPMEKGQRAPAGFTPIPNSKHGGWHKRVGNGWESWYPDGRHETRHAHINVGKDHVYIQEPGDKYKRKMTRADYDKHQAEHKSKAGGLSVTSEEGSKTGKYWSKTQGKDGTEYRDHKGRPVGEKKRGFWQRLLGKGTWVPMASKLGEFAWGASLAKGGALITPRGAEVVEMRSELARLFVGPALWKAGSRGPFLKKVPTGKFRTKKDGSQGAPIFRYYYRVQHGGGVHNAEHFKEGASFAHGEGHYTIHGVKDGKLHVSHSSGGKKVAMTHDELAAKLAEHHKGALDAHKAKLTNEHAEAVAAGNHKGAEKIRAEAAKVGHKIEAPKADKPKKPAKAEPAKAKRSADADFAHAALTDPKHASHDSAWGANAIGDHDNQIAIAQKEQKRRPGTPYASEDRELETLHRGIKELKARGEMPQKPKPEPKSTPKDEAKAMTKEQHALERLAEKDWRMEELPKLHKMAKEFVAHSNAEKDALSGFESALGELDPKDSKAMRNELEKNNGSSSRSDELRELERRTSLREGKAGVGRYPKSNALLALLNHNIALEMQRHATKKLNPSHSDAWGALVDHIQRGDNLHPETQLPDYAHKAHAKRREELGLDAKPEAKSPAKQDAEPKTSKPTPKAEPKPEPKAETKPHADRVAEAKERYGLKGREHDRLDAHEHTKKAAELHAAGDHEKAGRYLREAVKEVLYKNPERNMSPSTAESHMKQREAKAREAKGSKMTKALRAFVSLWKGTRRA